MSDYEPPTGPVPQTPGVADHAAVVRTDGVSPKAAASGAVGLGVGVLIAVLNAVQEANLLGGLPMPLQVILLAAIPPVLAFLASYSASPGTVKVQGR